MNLRRALSPGAAFGLAIWALAVRRLAFAHLAILHDGSPKPSTPRAIDDVTLAQAFYARLAPGGSDHYAFRVAADCTGRLILLLPAHAYDAGFRADVVLRGPRPEDDGRSLPGAGDTPLTIAGVDYRLAAALSPELAPGDYRLEVRATGDAAGVYSLCVGDREAGVADPATRARIRALIDAA